MSVVPLIRAARPTPEPPPVTWMVVPGILAMNVSASRAFMITIVSEPLIVTGLAANSGSAMAAARMAVRIFFIVWVPLEGVLVAEREDVVVGIVRLRFDELVR